MRLFGRASQPDPVYEENLKLAIYAILSNAKFEYDVLLMEIAEKAAREDWEPAQMLPRLDVEVAKRSPLGQMRTSLGWLKNRKPKDRTFEKLHSPVCQLLWGNILQIESLLGMSMVPLEGKAVAEFFNHEPSRQFYLLARAEGTKGEQIVAQIGNEYRKQLASVVIDRPDLLEDPMFDEFDD